MGLTRKEIKRDQIKSFLTRFYDWALENQRFLVGGLLAAVLVILGLYLWDVVQQSRDREVQAAFGEAMGIYHAEVAPADPVDGTSPASPPRFADEAERNAKALEAFEALRNIYPGTRMAAWARLYAAMIRQDTGDAETARDELNQLSHNAPVKEVRNLAAQRLADLAERENQIKDAIVYCRLIVDDPARNFPLDGILMQLAGLYEKDGNLEGALAQYRRIQSDFPNSPQIQDAEAKINQLAPQEGTQGVAQ